MTHKIIKVDNYLLVVDDSEIKVGDYFYSIREIVEQAVIDYPKNEHHGVIIAHLPLNGSPILEGVDLLPPYSRHQEEGIEELAQEWYDKGELTSAYSFKAGYNKAREKYKYTEDDVWKAIVISKSPNEYGDYLTINDIIQSLHQYPTEFEKDDYQMSTLSNGQQVWVGKYK
jgi:hypothetical protein